MKCEHNFIVLGGRPENYSLLEKFFYWFFSPNTYSVCSKCGLIKHDRDGHTFRTIKEAIEEAKK